MHTPLRTTRPWKHTCPRQWVADSFDDALVEIRDSSIDQAQRILIYLAIF